jgi:hypothetical protein
MIRHGRYNACKREVAVLRNPVLCVMTAELFLMADPVHSRDKGQG